MAGDRGIYRKFTITRTDGSSEPGGKHEHCTYFVLDLDHDPHAIAALEAYAKSCQGDHPELARGLERALAVRPCRCREAFCGHFGPQHVSEAVDMMMESTDFSEGERR